MKPLIQDEKTNEKPYHEELAPAGGGEGNNKNQSKIKVLKDGDLASSMGDDNSSIGTGSFGGNRTSGSFAGTNGNKNSFSEVGGRASFGGGGNATSFNNNTGTSFRSSYNGK